MLSLIEGYRFTVSPAAPVDVDPLPEWFWPPNLTSLDYDSKVKNNAQEWRDALNNKEEFLNIQALSDEEFETALFDSVPHVIMEHWHVFTNGITEEFSEDIFTLFESKYRNNFHSLLFLHAVADEVFAESRDIGQFIFVSHITTVQLLRGTISRIDEKRGRVLFKEHTPQVGLSMRSISRNLTFIMSPVTITWTRGAFQQPETVRNLNFLLVPWPLHVHATDFKKAMNAPRVNLVPKREFFCFRPDLGQEKISFEHYVKSCISAAEREVGKIHMVVTPESSIGYDGRPGDALSSLESILVKSGIDAYIAGVRSQSVDAIKSTDLNGVMTASLKSDGSEFARRNLQHKHHRWILDSSQIDQYSIGSNLDSDITWYENIEIQPRSLHLFSLGKITVCPLICEDLARQDPVADVVRALGPSIVVVLLMDGPQFTDRWSAKYASVLNDDPGSAVLTLTSMGMVRRWRSVWRPQRDVIGLWKDSDGPVREICLTAGANAAVLSVQLKDVIQYTADGRSGSRRTHEVKLVGIHPIDGMDR